MSPAEKTLALLRILGQVDGSTNWRGVFSTLPDKLPDNVVALFDADPQIDGRPMRPSTTEEYQHPAIQIIVRSVEYSTGWAKLLAVLDALRSVSHRTEAGVNGGTKFLGYYLKSGPAPMGRREEPNVRRLFVANLTTALEDT